MQGCTHFGRENFLATDAFQCDRIQAPHHNRSDGKELPLSFLAGGDSEGSVVPSMETADELSDEERRVLQKAGSQGKLRNAEVQGLLGAVIQRLEKFSLDSWIKGC